MGKKDPKVMAKQREAFLDGAKAKGVSEKKALKLFELIEYFAGYGFNKSHSAAYALLAYETAFLKANYPWHFAAALFTIEAQNTEKLAMYLAEARERGIPVLSSDINESQLNFSVESGKGVRFGLTAIKGLGEGAINSILSARAQLGGRIPSLHALCEILDLRLVNRRVFEALIKSGACDSLLADRSNLRAGRARLFAAIDAACEHGARKQRDNDLGQHDLFGGDDTGGGAPGHMQLPTVPAWTEIEQLNYEKEALGLYWSGHPIDRYADDLREYGAKSTAELLPKKDDAERAAGLTGSPAEPEGLAPHTNGGTNGRGEEISIGGIVSGLRPLKTRKGDRMCVFMLEDASGSLEIVVFPETFKQHGHFAENGNTVLVRGKFERDDESARIIASEIVPIGLVRERLAKSVAIRLTTPPADRQTFERLWDVFAQHKGDRRVAIVLHECERHMKITVDVNGIKVRPSETLVSEVEKICGAGSVTLR
jgi:DNA polymerase-3 subunit alpha